MRITATLLAGTMLLACNAQAEGPWYATAKFAYNTLGINEYRIEAETGIPSGEHQVRAEFAYDGGGLGKGGTVSLYYDGSKVGEGRVEETQGIIFSADETLDVGYESGTPVTPDYPVEESRFSGTLAWARIDLGEDDHGHMVDPDHVIKVAMSRQ